MKDFVLMDGGHETQLRKYVGSGFEGHPLWVCRYLEENPEAIRQVCQDFIENGSEMILTCTYQATVDGFNKYMGKSQEESIKLIKLGVTLCKEAVAYERAKGITRTVLVVGLIGPYGAYLHDGSEYTGGKYVDHMTTQDLMEWHRPRLDALLEAGSDCLIFGTIPSIKEAEALILLLKQHPGKKAFVSFSAQNATSISNGEEVSKAALHCWQIGSDQILAIGVNCQHPQLSSALLRSVKQADPNIPLFVMSNSTEIFNTQTREWEVSNNEKSLVEYCQDWLSLGVKYIGGCCRTTVDDIGDFREEIRKFTNETH